MSHDLAGLMRFDPAGRLERRVAMPVKDPVLPTVGARDLDIPAPRHGAGSDHAKPKVVPSEDDLNKAAAVRDKGGKVAILAGET